MEELRAWIAERHGIVHRTDVLRAGFSVAVMRSFLREGHAGLIRRTWLALPAAPPSLVIAAQAGGRVSCVTLARMRGWWMPEGIDPHPHLHLTPGTGSARLPARWPGTLHWTKPISPVGRALVGTVEDALAHIALCLSFESALVLWESASRIESYAPDALRAIRWTNRAARELA